jgi:hypothetical protein
MLAAHIELVLLVTGVATAGGLVVAVAPVPVMKVLFGQAPADALGLFIARHWGLLVSLVGALLIYAAYHGPPRYVQLRRFGVTTQAEEPANGIGLVIWPVLVRMKQPQSGTYHNKQKATLDETRSLAGQIGPWQDYCLGESDALRPESRRVWRVLVSPAPFSSATACPDPDVRTGRTNW